MMKTPPIIGITFSTFDLLHAGHVEMLREARSQCDYLIVGLQLDPTIDRPDTKNKPIQSLVERFTQVSAVRFVDEVIPYQTEQDVIAILGLRKIDVRILGEEYKGGDFTGRDLCVKLGIRLYFNQRNHGFSTTMLRARVREAERPKE